MVLVNDKWEVEWQPGMTVAAVLVALHFTHTVLVVSVNGSLVPPAEYTTHPVADGDLVRVTHVIAGG
jgi:thiamine biosynthesis protein ThiS